MRIHLFAALVALLPLSAVAQTETTAVPVENSGSVSPLLVTAGVVGAVMRIHLGLAVDSSTACGRVPQGRLGGVLLPVAQTVV